MDLMLRNIGRQIHKSTREGEIGSEAKIQSVWKKEEGFIDK